MIKKLIICFAIVIIGVSCFGLWCKDSQAEISLKLPFPKGEAWLLTRGYGPNSTHKSKDLYALDFTLNGCKAYGRPVIAVAVGTVERVETGRSYGERNYGNMVVIDHGNGLKSLYGHLKDVSVNEGDGVVQGQQVGEFGNTGYCLGHSCSEYPGTHLHFAMYKDNKAYKPEPMSGYTGFIAGKWYTSDNIMGGSQASHQAPAITIPQNNSSLSLSDDINSEEDGIQITVSGTGEKELVLLLFLDGTKVGQTIINSDGSWAVSSVTIPEGNHTLKASTTRDDETKASEVSVSASHGYVWSGVKIVEGAEVVPEGQTLVIGPGTVVKMGEKARFIVHGTIKVQGTESSPVVFTSIRDDEYGGDTNGDGAASAPNPGDWKKVELYNSSGSEFIHIKFRYGGYDLTYLSGAQLYLEESSPTISQAHFERSFKVGVAAISGSAPVITNSVFDNHGDYGIHISDAGSDAEVKDCSFVGNNSGGINIERGAKPTISNNTFMDNLAAIRFWGSANPSFSGNSASSNTYNGILTYGSLGEDQTWDSNLPFFFLGKGSGTFQVPEGEKLTIAKGNKLLFAEDTAMHVYGGLNVLGEKAERVRITSARSSPKKGDWRNIHFYPGSKGSFQYAEIMYGGRMGEEPILELSTRTILTQADEQPTPSYGVVYIENAEVDITRSTITHNLQGVAVTGDSSAELSENNIYDNDYYAIANMGPSTVAAENNWWEADDPFMMAQGNIDYDPWANEPFADWLVFDERVQKGVEWVVKRVRSRGLLPVSIH